MKNLALLLVSIMCLSACSSTTKTLKSERNPSASTVFPGPGATLELMDGDPLSENSQGEKRFLVTKVSMLEKHPFNLVKNEPGLQIITESCNGREYQDFFVSQSIVRASGFDSLASFQIYLSQPEKIVLLDTAGRNAVVNNNSVSRRNVIAIKPSILRACGL